MENTALAVLIASVTHEICLAILKEQGRIDASLIHENRLRPLTVNIIGIHIKVLVICIICGHHVKASLMVTDRWCKDTAGAVDTL